MKHFVLAAALALAFLAGVEAAGAQTQPTDPAHPLTNPQAPASDCGSDSVRGANPPCGPSNKTQTKGAPAQRK